jgi:hypothetical protein
MSTVSRRDIPMGVDLCAAVDRLKAMAAGGSDALLTDGPVHPDAKLLDLCADIAYARKVVEVAFQRRINCPPAAWMCTTASAAGEVVEAKMAEEEADKNYSHLLRSAAKIKATTAAGLRESHSRAIVQDRRAVSSHVHGGGLVGLSRASGEPVAGSGGRVMAQPDTAIIAICDRAMICEYLLRTIDEEGAEEETIAAAIDNWRQTFKATAATPATTPDGIVAKAGVLRTAVVREAVWDTGVAVDDPPEIIRSLLSVAGVIAVSLVDDLLAASTRDAAGD